MGSCHHCIYKEIVLQESVEPVSKQMVNGGPAAVPNDITTLSSNLLELDSLLSDLDAIELSNDFIQHAALG